MANCIHCHQPQTVAMVICSECAAALTIAPTASERTKTMEFNELITQLRSVSVETGSLVCLGCGHEHHCGIHGCAILRAAADSMEVLADQFADLQTRFDKVNDFEQSQCAKVMVKLAERDEQLAAAVEQMEQLKRRFEGAGGRC